MTEFKPGDLCIYHRHDSPEWRIVTITDVRQPPSPQRGPTVAHPGYYDTQPDIGPAGAYGDDLIKVPDTFSLQISAWIDCLAKEGAPTKFETHPPRLAGVTRNAEIRTLHTDHGCNMTLIVDGDVTAESFHTISRRALAALAEAADANVDLR